jgi:hypothetical protein
MGRSRLVQVVVNYQQAGRLLDCYIQTGKNHEAQDLESVTSTTTTTTTMIMIMMMMMTTTIIVMMMMVVVGIMVVTVTVRQEMTPKVHLNVTCQEGLRNNALEKCI